ncbi:MAG: urea amidolyase, partial [Paracoccaceae bacterium]|nr:urea amidolyase [Paracoccaceae bacterium]
TPFVLLPECQTTGGYPRIGTVIPPDLAIVAQATPKDSLTFTFVAPEDAEQATTAWFKEMEDLPRKVRPLVRDPHDIADLLSYQLISGTVSAQEDPE